MSQAPQIQDNRFSPNASIQERSQSAKQVIASGTPVNLGDNHKQSIVDRLLPEATTEGLMELITPTGFSLDPADFGIEASIERLGKSASSSVRQVRVIGFVKSPSTGNEVLAIDIRFRQQGDRRYIHWEGLSIKPEHQGHGIGKYLITKLMLAGFANDYEAIELVANAEVGRYYWATAGWGFKDSGVLDSYKAKIRNFLSTRGLMTPRNQANLNNLTKSWEVAAFKAFDDNDRPVLLKYPKALRDRGLHGTNAEVGKVALLSGGYWNGILQLDETAPTFLRMRKHLGI